MKLVVDIGNTNIVLGLKNKEKWQHIWRLETNKKASEYQYSLKINNLLWEEGLNPNDINHTILSTVVPELKNPFIHLLYKLNHTDVIVMDKHVYPQLNLNILNPDEIGSDLVANVLSAHNKYRQNSIIIDFGTALTFTVVDRTGKILGVNIAPGIKTAINALSDKTSQLDPVPLILPKNPLGQDTQTAIQNGVLIGYTGLISHMIEVIKNKVGQNYKVIATGGLSEILSHHLPQIEIIDKHLTLDGLAMLPDFVD